MAWSRQYCGGAERRRRLANAVLVEEQLHDAEALALAAEDRRVRHAHVGETDVGVVGGHVERPQELDDLEARGCSSGTRNAVMPVAVARLAAGAGEDQVVGRLVDAGVPGLLAVDDPGRRRRGPRWSPCGWRRSRGPAR